VRVSLHEFIQHAATYHLLIGVFTKQNDVTTVKSPMAQSETFPQMLNLSYAQLQASLSPTCPFSFPFLSPNYFLNVLHRNYTPHTISLLLPHAYDPSRGDKLRQHLDFHTAVQEEIHRTILKVSEWISMTASSQAFTLSL